MNVLSINNHIVIFIMNFINKLLVYIQVSISIFKNILITICIWIKGTHRKNIVLSQKWTTITCIYPTRDCLKDFIDVMFFGLYCVRSVLGLYGLKGTT
jgi:hypothetical protein